MNLASKPGRSSVSSIALADSGSTPSAWRNPFVWLIVALPGSAVVASLITAVIAVVGADPIVAAREPGKVIERVDPMLPAQKARNRAAEARGTAATAP